MSNNTTSLSISGMSCNHCAASVEKALHAVPGVETVMVTLEQGIAVITGSMDKDSLIAAVNDAGYKAK